ncbi:TetR/AcrR family transcriptional regulator [Sulfurisoma sediminicola]|uniref:TetR family transcriptional regulator n=1 Tax=Sulfurisoma sediminicola TaxID=1381557 RepID=A0A497XJA7_9PROT|nr:TetR/AcrR family transcriptional regulator [Sulfurisoma sediminicola]RLJ68022.1 TetR family transcriptional regulator [Sulfurisoma sediminicola]
MAEVMDAAIKPRQRRKEARPAELLAAALEVFAEKGFAATRLEEIAARAGVSKGTVYLYFESKEALFKAAIETAMTPAVEAVEAIANDPTRPAAEMLRCFVVGWWERIGTTQLGAVPKILVAESGNFPEVARWFHETIISRAQRAVARLIQIGIERGEFHPVDPMLAARVVFSPMFAIIIWRRAFGHFMPDLPEPRRFLDEALAILTYGLVARKKDES